MPADPVRDLFFVEVREYEDLRAGVRARVEQLNIPRSCLDEITGLPAGYCSKLLATGESKADPIAAAFADDAPHTRDVPASLLSEHVADIVVVLDEQAAARL